ncbi:uncharacterized protein LOC117179103 isoform X2 [Belonocnema kinseyi]|uniref:uncharacterized protein LOC117179103 isoform X2 n=1 Tax=Belonocnema kinseyi TaxID=2817044 RepID=UPI00143DC0D9|nr:uncharacterized protein LOC117179103 isoform X2 [Belonocnema kinseyi]
MKLIRLIALIVSIPGCLALPPTQSSSRGPVRPKQTTSISTNAATSTTTAIMTNVSTEARVKTSASTSATTATKKSMSVKEATVTPPTSAKETRESPGKIRPQIKLTTNYTSASETGVRLPEGASAALAKPTKYHYYPHNQHIYLLPECAVQQALTLVKTCEPVAEMRECRAPRDWSLLALQNVRTGKSHYLVICRCPDTNILEGPMSHDQPTYASVPGIRVYGMMCVQGNRRGRPLRHIRSLLGLLDEQELIEENEARAAFPWHMVPHLMKTANWD